jgi:hypothetical protein
MLATQVALVETRCPLLGTLGDVLGMSCLLDGVAISKRTVVARLR